MKRKLTEQPREVAKAHWDATRAEVGCQPGQPFDMEIYASLTLKEEFKHHTTLHRMWRMLSAVHRLLWEGKPDQALAQTVQNLKATGKALKSSGQWKGAWEMTHLPDLQEARMGVSLEEEATTVRYLKEQAALEKLLEEARKK